MYATDVRYGKGGQRGEALRGQLFSALGRVKTAAAKTSATHTHERSGRTRVYPVPTVRSLFTPSTTSQTGPPDSWFGLLPSVFEQATHSILADGHRTIGSRW